MRRLRCTASVVSAALALLLLLLCETAARNNASLPRPAVTLELGQRSSRRLLDESGDFPDAPLYPGYGTHFAYIFVGTPPQRVSVIIDTGSHYTAFPCTGCANCGTHTDPYFDPDRSSTARINTCNQGQCVFRQSYSEGSSWVAYKVVDKLWVGAELVTGLELSNFAIDFMFGCQTSETGLFRTQLADGIMGMSAQSTTLVPQLFSKGVIKHNLFALCFKDGGGAMTLGGVDTSAHLGPIQYVRMVKPSGWFTVRLLDLQIGGKSIDVPSAKYNTGKGVIVDSGTTDTYLPSAIRQAFINTMKNVAGVNYSTGKLAFTQQEFEKLPTLTFVFEDGVEIDMPPTSYMDRVGKDRYMFRVYLTEGSGAVLGANFMKDMDVIFDMERKRVGFAPANCEYVYHTPPAREAAFAPEPAPAPSLPAPAPVVSPPGVLPPTLTALPDGCIYTELLPLSGCNATCSPFTTAASSGYQRWGRTLARQGETTCPPMVHETFEQCSITCSNGTPVHGVPACSVSPWSKCDSVCTQVREVRTLVDGPAGRICRSSLESRMCNVGLCPSAVGDFFVVLDMKVAGVSTAEWMAGAVKDDYRAAIGSVLNISEGTVELMTSPDATMDKSPVSHIQFQIRIARTEGEDGASRAYHAASQLQQRAYAADFPRSFVNALNKVGASWESMEDGVYVRTLSAPSIEGSLSVRYGWMQPSDIVVSHVSAVPISGGRDPIEIPLFVPEPAQPTDGPLNAISSVITSVAVVSCVVALIALYLNHRLRTPKTPKSRVDAKRGATTNRRVRFQKDDWERRRLMRSDSDDDPLESQL